MNPNSASPSDPHLLRIFQTEIHTQARFAVRAASDFERELKKIDDSFDHDQFWFSMDAALGALARLSDICWPVRNQGAAKARSEMLRAHFGIGATNALQSKDARNGMEHFAERIDTWSVASASGNYADRIVGRAGLANGIDAGDFARSYDPESTVVTVFGASLNLQDAFDSVIALTNLVPDPNAPGWA